jgi:hypothetical protein
MANTINYAAVFNRILDEKFYVMPRTLWMENTNPGIVWDGGKEVKIPTLSMDGLGDMEGCEAPSGDLVLDYETHRLQWYRGRDFKIPRYAVNETNFALTVGNAIRVFLNSRVIPEVDRLRIATAAQGALSYGQVHAYASGSITSANILGLLMDDIAAVQDEIGEDEQLYIHISTKLKNLLEQSTQINRYLSVRDFAIRSANLKIEALNDQYLIGTPSSYMHSVVKPNNGRVEGEKVGGVSFGNFGAKVNWIISARPAVDAVARPQITKVIDPDVNQLGDCWKIMFNMYHGLWSMREKGPGILVNIDTTAGELTVASVAGTAAAGDSILTVTGFVPDGYKYVWKAASGTAPAVSIGTALTASDGWADLADDGLIKTTNGYKVTVALVSAASRQPVAYGTATVVAKT